jgi:hypothetical protein
VRVTPEERAELAAIAARARRRIDRARRVQDRRLALAYVIVLLTWALAYAAMRG